MWWRSAAVFVAGGVLGTAFGVALGFFMFPYVFPPPPAAERLSEIERTSPVVAEGRFPATADGYRDAVELVDGHSVDTERAWIIEGSAGYGRGRGGGARRC